MRVHLVPQRSPEWHALKLGKVGSSRAAAVVAKIKSGEAAAYRDCRTDIVVERLSGEPSDGDPYTSKEMQRGIDKESAAVAAYEARTSQIVRRAGFIEHDTLAAGYSPDGYIGAGITGIIEVKCPKKATHISYIRAGVVPSAYRPQCVHGLWITGARWCDFVSFDDRFPGHLQLFVVRMHRNDEEIATYDAQLRKFLNECDVEEAALRTMAGHMSVMAEAVA